MLDQSLLQSHFIGRDGFRWWIGQIPPIEAMGEQVEGGGWGNRFKVRILGYHPYSTAELPNEDLPWAQVLIPTTSGSGAANCATGVQLQPSDIVLGFFLDGDNAQIPVILATFGRTDSVPSTTYKSPFEAFTGFSSLIESNPKTPPSESNEVKENSQPTPPTRAQTSIPVNEAVGDLVTLANTVQNTKISRIKAIITNLLKKLKKLQGNIDNIKQEISKAIDKITLVTNEFVGSLLNGLINGTENFPGLKGLLKEGLKLLYDLIFAKILAATGNPAAAHLAGVAAQEAMVVPVRLFEEAFKCLKGKAIDLINGIVEEILTSTLENVTRFVSCAADQFTGSLLNSIVGVLESLVEGPLGGLSTLLQFFSNFNPGNLMRSVIGGLASGGVAAFACNQDLSSYKGIITDMVIGGDMKFSDPNPFPNIQNIATIASSGVDPKSIGNCFSGALEFASPPIINIFGGPGSGATAIPIFGNLVKDSNGNTTASIIGAQVTNSGSGYTFPPFVEIFDDNDQGYGAIARSIINDKGEVTAVYIVSEGENYSVGNIEQYSIIDVVVQDGGNGYVKGDTVVDNLGNQYETQVVDGRIYQVTPLNNIVDSFPILTTQSSSGSGAILRPLLGTSRFTGETQTSIDCPI
jgi:hypothetical protein